MNPHRDRIIAPGLRDKDWAHASYDDMHFAASQGRNSSRRASPPVVPESLAGRAMRSDSGEALGTVSEILVDVATGRVAYAVVSVDAGLGKRLHAVPWTSLRYDATHDCLEIDAAKAILDGAPTFDPESWSMRDERWEREVHAFYRATPYWE